MHAVVRSRGKQYRVTEGQTFAVDRLDVKAGDTVDLEVLALADGDDVRLGTPLLDGAVASAEVVGEVKGPKIEVLRYKNKVRYRKHTGHRSRLTELRVTNIKGNKGK